MSSAWPAASPDRVSPAQLYSGHLWRVTTRPPAGSGSEPDSAARTPAPAFDVSPAGSTTGGQATAHPFVHVTFLRSDRGDNVQRVALAVTSTVPAPSREGAGITAGAAWAALSARPAKRRIRPGALPNPPGARPAAAASSAVRRAGAHGAVADTSPEHPASTTIRPRSCYSLHYRTSIKTGGRAQPGPGTPGRVSGPARTGTTVRRDREVTSA